MANKIYQATESLKSFRSSGGDAVLTMTSVANGVGRISGQVDLGASARSRIWRYLGRAKVAANPALNNQVRLYLVGSDGTYQVGELGTADAAVTSEDRFRNAIPLLPIDIDDTVSTRIYSRQGFILIPHRYISVGWWNATGQAMSATATDCEFILEAVPDEIQ